MFVRLFLWESISSLCCFFFEYLQKKIQFSNSVAQIHESIFSTWKQFGFWRSPHNATLFSICYDSVHLAKFMIITGNNGIRKPLFKFSRQFDENNFQVIVVSDNSYLVPNFRTIFYVIMCNEALFDCIVFHIIT